MEPLPETATAFEHLAKFGNTDLADEVDRISRNVRDIVPDIVGISYTLVLEGLSFTLVSDSRLARDLDVVQYADDGPCLAAVEQKGPVDTTIEDTLSESRWSLFARAQAATNVRSTLSLPILEGDDVVAGVNLYASADDAFDGKHVDVARVCRAWAPGAVTNADLAFRTREEAAEAPRRLEEQDLFDRAVGVLAAVRGISVETAVGKITQAAQRAGVTLAQAAETLIRVLLEESS